MPRGVYDRSKTKEQRATEKAATPAKAGKVGKRKYTKRAAAAAAPVAAPELHGVGAVMADSFHNDLMLFNTFSSAVSNLSGNTALYGKLTSKISTLIDRLLPDAPVAPKVEKSEKKAETVEKKAEAVAAPIPAPTAGIPVPIPVPVPFNGSSPS